MTAPAPAAPPTRALLTRVVRTYVAPHWKGLAFATLCAALAAGLTFAITYMLKPFLNGMDRGADLAAILRTAGLIAVLGVLRALALAGQVRVSSRLGHVMVGEIQADLLDRAVRADLARLRNTHTGGFVSSMLYDVDKVREATTTGLVNWTQNGLLLLAMLGLMVAQDLGLVVLVLLAAPLAFETIRKFSNRTARAANDAMVETSALSTAILESLDGVKVIKLENREAAERERVGKVIGRRQHFLIKGSNAKNLVQPTSELIMTLLIAAILAYAGWRATTGATCGAWMSPRARRPGSSPSLRRRMASSRSWRWPRATWCCGRVESRGSSRTVKGSTSSRSSTSCRRRSAPWGRRARSWRWRRTCPRTRMKT
ncbi:MAG: ABC transporter ATP-binding protein [Caulobacteraceae bacterium]|nr:MAG: ABC transporter ATP-binding protein [Caulobacteraceae bacterium]